MTVNPRQSFKLKLCISILISSLIAFALIFSATFYFTGKEIRSNVESIVSSKLILATRALDDKLSSIEIASDNLIGMLNSPYVKYNIRTASHVARTYLEANHHVQGVCMGYPDATEFGHPGPWCPYVMRKDGEYIRRDLAAVKDFMESEWFKTPAETGKPSWSKPFRESNGTVIASFNKPVYDEDGNLLCVVAVDQSLNDLSDSLQILRPYEGSNLYMIDSEGEYVAHPDHDQVLVSSVSEEMLENIRSGELYFIEKVGKKEVYYFPASIPRTGWIVLLEVPRSAMVDGPTKMMNTILIDMILGLILLLCGSLYVINRLTKPLESFAEAAREIAHGDFHVDLPVIKDHNELWDLRAALASMEVSLDSYIKQLAETTGQKAAFEKELDIARNIQMSMIPKVFPPYPERDNLDIFASLTPAQAVGGDLYDFALCGDKFFFCIGDVSGKGVPASLFMAITRTLFRNTASETKTPSEIAKVINNAMTEGNDLEMFVTMIIASFDLMTGELKICNCGHNLPVTNGSIADPATMVAEPTADYHLINGIPANIAIGVMPGFDYKDVTMSITPGCMLLLYTDGVTEAENIKSELYDESRMIELLDKAGTDCDSKTLIDSLVADVNDFVGDAEQSDDITVLCLRCNRLGK